MKSTVATRIKSVNRLVSILTSLVDMPRADRSARRIADATGIPLPSIYHFLNTCTEAGILIRDANDRYQLGPTLHILAADLYENTALPRSLVRFVERIATTLGETAHFSAWRRGAIEILFTAPGTNPIRVATLPNRMRGEEHARASGKLLIALSRDELVNDFLARDHAPITSRTITSARDLQEQFADIRRNGYSTEYGEFISEMGCAAVPIYTPHGLYGAVTVSAPLSRFMENERRIISCLIEGTADLDFYDEASTRIPEPDSSPQNPRNS